MIDVIVNGVAHSLAARTGDDALWLSTADLERVCGWSLKPEGLCQGEVCVPVSGTGGFVDGDQVDVAAFWRHLGKPLAHSADGSVWSLGESGPARTAALESLEAPDFALPDLDGHYHSLSDFQRKKVLLITWASW